MKNHFVAIVASFALLLSTISNAKASTVTVDLGPVLGNAFYSVGDDISAPGNIDLNNLVRLDYYHYQDPTSGTIIIMGGGLSGVAQDSWPGLFTKPTGVPAEDKFLFVYGYDSGDYHYSGSASFELKEGMDTFSFTWGSMEDFNSLRIVNENNQDYRISAATILANQLIEFGPDKTKRFTIHDPAGLRFVELLSDWPSFEAGNFSATPLPAALPMFGLALAGVAALRRKKKA